MSKNCTYSYPVLNRAQYKKQNKNRFVLNTKQIAPIYTYWRNVMNEERGRNEFEESDVHLIKIKTIFSGWQQADVYLFND